VKPIRVLLVDDHKAICSGITSFLNQKKEFEVLGELNSGQELYSYIVEQKPDVIVLDIKLNNDEVQENGLTLTKELRSKKIRTPIVIYSGYDFPPYEKTAYNVGANAFLSKNESLSKLSEIIVLVHQGMTIKNNHLFEEEEALNEQEIQVLNWIAKGNTNKEIAKKMYASARTIEYHISSVYSKLNVDSRIRAVMKGMNYGYIVEEIISQTEN
jgi:DNA-binding NarL/FixJ family response regulator